MEDKHYCCTCKHYAHEEGVCCNADSEYVADFMCMDDWCEKWSEEDGTRMDKTS